MKNTIPLQPVTSSRIAAIGHDPGTKTLAIEFKPGKGMSRGSIYHYANVPPEKFEAFKAAESIGSHFSQNFKNNTAHPYERIDDAVAAEQEPA